MLLAGVALLWPAFMSGHISLLQRISMPLLFLSLGVLLIRVSGPSRVVALVVFLVALAGLQVTATVESLHIRELRETTGTITHWH